MWFLILSLSIFFLTLGIVLGVKLNKWNIDTQFKMIKMKELKKTNEIYRELMYRFLNKRTQFKTRINQSIVISTTLENIGEVDIIYVLDKKEISIFQKSTCISNGQGVQPEITNRICEIIEKTYKDKISDVVDVMGMFISRTEFERAIHYNMQQIKKQFEKQVEKQEKEISHIEKIIQENENKFDIDEILDKINKVGINNLTQEELEFLQNYSTQK